MCFLDMHRNTPACSKRSDIPNSIPKLQVKPLQTLAPSCRFCKSELELTLVDLGMTPLCENLRRSDAMEQPEAFYPLRVLVCERCWLAQLQEYVTPDDIFREYAYFSSVSESWVEHARKYVGSMTQRLSLAAEDLVVEVASNDGYLLQHFVDAGIPVLGIEPAVNVAQVAQAKGIRCVTEFFGVALAEQLRRQGESAKLLLGNNVLAHVPDINDFVAGLKILLADSGTLTLEFPHLLELMKHMQFDTVYHEHFSYLSLTTVQKIFAQHQLKIFDVDRLSTHGGSLRIYACHMDSPSAWESDRVADLLQVESEFGIAQPETYTRFQARVIGLKQKILRFFLTAAEQGKSVVGYGAPGKGVTLLHYCGIDVDMLSYTVDRNTYKQGHYLPGTGIAIHPPEKIFQTQPDYIFILPWNLRDEIQSQMHDARSWGAKFVIPIPDVEII